MGMIRLWSAPRASCKADAMAHSKNFFGGLLSTFKALPILRGLLQGTKNVFVEHAIDVVKSFRVLEWEKETAGCPHMKELCITPGCQHGSSTGNVMAFQSLLYTHLGCTNQSAAPKGIQENVAPQRNIVQSACRYDGCCQIMSTNDAVTHPLDALHLKD